MTAVRERCTAKLSEKEPKKLFWLVSAVVVVPPVLEHHGLSGFFLPSHLRRLLIISPTTL